MGGEDASDPSSSATESWNGSAWTEITEINTGRRAAGSSGTQTSALVFGNMAPYGAITESWDGTSWTEVADLSTARATGCDGGTTGSNSDAIYAGGRGSDGGDALTATEEWSAPSTFRQLSVGDIYYNADPGSGVLKYVGYGTGAWASGPVMNDARYAHFGFGIQTAAMAAGGAPINAESETYNGTAWTETNDINDSRSNEGGAGSGTTTAGLIYGGHNPGFTANSEEFDGTSWSEEGDLNTARRNLGGAGTQTATFAMAGKSPPSTVQDAVESYNGTTWTETTEINTARECIHAIGQTSAALLGVGGFTNSALTEEWDGSSWSEKGDLNTNRSHQATRGGTSTSGIIAGGQGDRIDNTEEWNGSSWTEVADLATAVYGINGQGATSKAAVAFGGNSAASDPAGTTQTEEWTVPEALKTLTSTNA